MSCNINAFSEPLDKAKRYWIGFLLADGNIHSTKAVVRLNLAQVDHKHIVKFREFLRATNKIFPVPGGSSLSVGSQQLVKDLAHWGILPRKTYGFDPVMQDLAFDPDFWRGVIDGDGCLYISRKFLVLKLTGTSVVVNQFADFVATITHKRLKVQDQPTFSWVHVTGNNAKAVVRVLYNEPDPVLNRKLAKVESFLSWKKS